MVFDPSYARRLYGVVAPVAVPSDVERLLSERAVAASLSHTGAFLVEDRADRYVVGPVLSRGVAYEVDLSKELLDGGVSRTQDQWVDRLRGDEWRLPSGDLLVAFFSALYRERQGSHRENIAAIRKMLKKDYADLWMMTSTRVVYGASGLDRVVHDHGMSCERELTGCLVGPDAWVDKKSGLETEMGLLLGTADLVALRDVLKWVSGRKPYLWRLNKAPKEDVARALVLGVGVRCNVYAGGVGIDRPARGVAVREIFSTGNKG